MKAMMTILIAIATSAIFTGSALAHCDTMNGPIVPEAQAALEKGDITPILKWVKPEHENELTTAFEKTLSVRKKGRDAKELADRYFLETFVRIHRAGEGAPYTGLKDEPVVPIVAIADKALEDRSADKMIEKITAHVAQGIREKYKAAQEAKKHADHNVEAGREYVEAYVTYVHYVEGIRNAVMSSGHDHAEADAGTEKHKEHKR